MWRERHAKCNSIARIPSAAWAHSIEEHARTELDSLIELGGLVITTLPGLLESNKCECSRDYPARRPWCPAPAELSWIELDLVVDSAEFPSPEPVCFAAS